LSVDEPKSRLEKDIKAKDKAIANFFTEIIHGKDEVKRKSLILIFRLARSNSAGRNQQAEKRNSSTEGVVPSLLPNHTCGGKISLELSRSCH
jgi:hypothetical protein